MVILPGTMTTILAVERTRAECTAASIIQHAHSDMSYDANTRFHHTSYTHMWLIAILMGCAYTTVAFSSRRSLQLLGVVFSALQGGLGEASCLAMCTFFDSRAAITFWSSGTGFAGIVLFTKPSSKRKSVVLS